MRIISQGDGMGNFEPEKPITRQEAAKMIANYLKISDTNHDKIVKFPDYNQVANWAINEFEAIIERGYIKGDDLGMLSPRANMTRAGRTCQ